ncbi:MAG TPA: hypothetical protein VGN55_13225 [Xanthobacteraceae bacterium]|jgi:hypothetical protein
MDKDKGTGPDQPDASSESSVDEERRESLRRLARFGAYTAPALLAMLASEKAPAATDS